ncbi:MAG: hypothetical protein NVS9B3_03590 [Gemmatimonadaceae bacterium]
MQANVPGRRIGYISAGCYLPGGGATRLMTRAADSLGVTWDVVETDDLAGLGAAFEGFPLRSRYRGAGRRRAGGSRTGFVFCSLRAASHVDRILRGKPPSEGPVEQEGA